MGHTITKHDCSTLNSSGLLCLSGRVPEEFSALVLFILIQGCIETAFGTSHTTSVLYLQIEVATGRFPYPKWTNVFDQLTQVVKGDAPSLDNDNTRFSPDFINFVNTW